MNSGKLQENNVITNAEAIQKVFEQGAGYTDYVATGTSEQQQRWEQMAGQVSLTEVQKELLAGFVREMKVLVLSGIWCGDCVEQCPLFAAIADGSDKIDLRFVDRDEQEELADQIPICGGKRVPVAIFMAEDYQLCSVYGDRSLNRYRKLAEKQLGAACSTGLFLPGEDEISVQLQDWLNEFERIQLLLRLSTRLRKKYGD